MDRIEFSVAISVYKNDDPLYFDRALNSIYFEQTVKPKEIVLIVDGPVPQDINSVISKYEDLTGVLRVIRLPVNKGLGNALRIAVEEASCDYIARMDSDDISLPDRFEAELSAFSADKDLDVVGGNISEFIGEENNIVAKRIVPKTDKEIKEYMKTRCPLNHVSVMYKKKSVLDSGNYLDLFWNEDYYLWIRMALKGAKMANTGKIAVNVRTGADMYKRRGGTKYFKSELFLQNLMLKEKMIGPFTYICNVMKRFVLQLVLPSSIRGWVFRTLARQ